MSWREVKKNARTTFEPTPAFSLFEGGEWILLALVLLCTVLAYAPAMQGEVLWDDDANITRPELESTHGLYRIWFEPGATQQYYPLLHTASWVEHKLWGDSTLGYHSATLLWHMVSIVLLYAIISQLEIPGALLAAAIFALHPVMVESVAWITEQKNTLSTMFYLGALLGYLRFDASRRKHDYFVSLGMFILALCAKTATVTFPAAMAVILWWQHGQLSWRRDLAPLVPFFALAGFAGLITCFVEWNHVGAVGQDFEFTFWERFLLAGRAVWFYLGKLLWPSNLIFFYPRWVPNVAQWWQWIPPLAVIATTVVLWALRKRWRTPLAVWLLYCGTVLPMLPFLNQYLFVYTFVADHFQYLASLGMIVLAAAGGTRLASLLLSPATQSIVAVLGCFVLGMLGLLTWQQVHLYADRLTLYTATIDRNPDCWIAHCLLGNELARVGNRAEAVEQYREAERLNPKNAFIQNNLCIALANRGKFAEALEAGRMAVSASPNNPEFLNNLAHVFVELQRYSEARELTERALHLHPGLAQAHFNLALALDGLGDRAGASQQFELAVQFQPENAESHYQLGELLEQVGKWEQALDQYQRVLQLDADFLPAYIKLAQALKNLNRNEDAIAFARRGIELAQVKGDVATVRKLERWITNDHPAEGTGKAITPSKSN